MKSALRGRVSFSVGETQLSPWEAGRLAPDDIVLTSRQAGYPGFVLFNNLPIGLGEVVVFDRSFGVRIVDTDFRPEFRVDPGRLDHLGEMLPAWLELGGFETELSALVDLGTNSFLNLGVPPAQASNAVLMVAGIPWAQGTVVVVGELMGLRVVEAWAPPMGASPVRASGNLADAIAAGQAKTYDFARPDRWSRRQLQRVSEVHRLFQRTIEASLPRVVPLLEGRDALEVDQCTLGEARELLASLGLPLRQTWEHEGSRPRGEPLETAPRKLFLEAEGPLSLTPGTRKFLEEHFGVERVVDHRPVFLHAGDWLDDADLPVVTRCLRSGWKRLLDFRLDPWEPQPTGLADYEMVVLVLFKSPQGGILGLVYPFLTIEPYANLLGS